VNIEMDDRGALRPAEACRWLGMSRDTFDRLCAADLIRSWKIGASRFVSRRELERFIAEREAEAR